MKNLFFTALFILVSVNAVAQLEKYPVFEGCESVDNKSLKHCFKTKVTDAVISAINLPDELTKDDFKGNVNVVFYVDREGKFNVLQVNSPYKEMKTEVIRVFNELPKVIPAKYNNHDIEMQFVLPIIIPLNSSLESEPKIEELIIDESIKEENLGLIKSDSLQLLEHHSELNLPYTHQAYSNIERYFNRGSNSHTAVKPYTYTDIEKYVDLDAQKNALMKSKSTWFGKKLLNEHMVQVQGEDYWFTLDPIVDLQVGKDNSDIDYTYNNTRGIQFQGGLGKKLSFSTSFYESQGRFANYVNQYAESLAANNDAGGNPAIIPGRGIAKDFKTDAYDYPVAEAYLSYRASKFFNLQLGHGKNFIGDGYRSLFLSDNSVPVPYFKISTNFWKIKYTNIWMLLNDVRDVATVEGVYQKKYMATHYLSLNVTKKLNIGLFESVVWDNTNERGFDANFLNPIIFYQALQFSTGSRSGNALMGVSAKYKWNDKISLYTQLLIDEFSTSHISKGTGSWKNKNGFQLGIKYFDAFKVENLYLQAEYNVVRPFTYSHNFPVLNYGNSNQSMAHPWGSNFNEFIGIANYNKGRWYGNAKLIVGKKGFDIEGDPLSYGGDIYRDYSDRNGDFGIDIGQGNTADIFIGDLQLGYLVNPATNLKFYGGFTYRSFNSESPTIFDSTDTTWFNIGLRTDLFDWKLDF
jgi:hypothetical protein